MANEDPDAQPDLFGVRPAPSQNRETGDASALKPKLVEDSTVLPPTVAAAPTRETDQAIESCNLRIVFDIALGGIRFTWWRPGELKVLAEGILRPAPPTIFFYHAIEWTFQEGGEQRYDGCTPHSASAHALIRRIRKLRPVAEDTLELGVLSHQDLGPAAPGQVQVISFPPGADLWYLMGTYTLDFARVLRDQFRRKKAINGRSAILRIARTLLRLPDVESPALLYDLSVIFDLVQISAEFVWKTSRGQKTVGLATVACTGVNGFTWTLIGAEVQESFTEICDFEEVFSHLSKALKRFPTNADTLKGRLLRRGPGGQIEQIDANPPREPTRALEWIQANLWKVADTAERVHPRRSVLLEGLSTAQRAGWDEDSRRRNLLEGKIPPLKQAPKRAKPQAPASPAIERQRRSSVSPGKSTKTDDASTRPASPLPEVPVLIEMPDLSFQDTAFPLESLKGYFLRERAALWWVSNQADDLLCLPFCKIERLEFQIRTALRVLGPLRGRALLSDEVGLGKTIEAGLVIKELLTRGMAKRFLVLTTPSLVDQWEEELNDKFGLATATTNQPLARAEPGRFWKENWGIVASLHTLKQPAHLEIACQLTWDILVVDEAHYLRNRDSMAWKAINSLSRQFLLLLTATPVQNSLEDLYNLVTLLQPGQLPSPKEFRARFIDPKRPRQPREPEELRRLVQQVMVRNTRANSGITLPPRRAETVLFQPDPGEKEFWMRWEAEFRQTLTMLNQAEAALWGRLVLQATGSSPAAWRNVLEKFPDRQARIRWQKEAPLEASWQRKCELLLPLTRSQGGLVVFTQFLQTQAALASFLRENGVPVFVINGTTPPPERQPLTESFRKAGGALLLTQSGTEGRNLQFCHLLANFDLPWNPMEIEQRIGRLHRLGQEHPVRIFNFVQAGTLQEYLLEILQDKLNLFELVVGETGLVLGERFGSDEFSEELFRRWRSSEGRVAEALAELGSELAQAREEYSEIKKLDETLFAKNYESL